MKSRICIDPEFKLTDVYKDEDEIICNVPQQLQMKWLRPRKIQTELMLEAVEKAIRICAKDGRPQCTSLIPMLVKIKKGLEKCGNFLAYDKIEFPENPEIKEKYLKINTSDCHKYCFCPRCQFMRMREAGIITYKIVKKINGYKYYLITLTFPNCGGDDLEAVLDVMNDALKRLKRRFIWSSCIDGDVTCLEIPPSQRLRGYHPHYHVTVAVPIEKDMFDDIELMEQWTSCINKALKKAGCSEVNRLLQCHIAPLEHTDRLDDKSENEIETEKLKVPDYGKIGGTRTLQQKAYLGRKSESIAMTVARSVMYSIKPNDRMIFFEKKHHTGHKGCKLGMTFDEFCDDYDEKDSNISGKAEFLVQDTARTAELLIPMVRALERRKMIVYSGIFREAKKEVEIENKEAKEYMKQKKGENTEKYLFSWHSYVKGYSCRHYEHAKISDKQREKLFKAQKGRPRKQVTPSMVKEIDGQLELISDKAENMPRKLCKGIEKKDSKVYNETDNVCQRNAQSQIGICRTINDLPDWLLSEFEEIIGFDDLQQQQQHLDRRITDTGNGTSDLLNPDGQASRGGN